MKCPECGFVSFPGLERCKKCGRRLTEAPAEPLGIPSLFPESGATTKKQSIPEFKTSPHIKESIAQKSAELDIELHPESAFSSPAEVKKDQAPVTPTVSEIAEDWQKELAARVEEYRQRRARLRGSKDQSGDMFELNFRPSPPAQPESRPNIIEFPSLEGLEGQPKSAPVPRTAPRKTSLGNFEPLFPPEDGGVKTSPAPKIPPPPPPPPEIPPLQIELGSSREASAAGIRAGTTSAAPSTSMSSRFFAGIIDGLVLLAGAAIYALIFWRTTGVVSLEPLALVVAAAVGVFFILLYFAGCTVLASATPGLIWNDLEVTTFEGNPPSLSDCLWRAFGYLVSMSALMLGFLWAAVDADGLTWHDRMSRTCIVPAEQR